MKINSLPFVSHVQRELLQSIKLIAVTFKSSLINLIKSKDKNIDDENKVITVKINC